MPDYTKGKIYKIVCNATGKIYVGSTTQQLCVRIAGHRAGYKYFKEGKRAFVTSFQIIEQGNYDMVLIENYPCQSKEDLHRRERHYIETLECVNKIVPTRTQQEYVEANVEKITKYKHSWYQDNRDSEKEHQYYIDNAEKIAEQQKKYNKVNAEKIAKRQKKYSEVNAEKIAEYQKKYGEVHAKKIAEYKKLYGEANAEKIAEYHKKLYKENKEKIAKQKTIA